jgi:hypothetical protein
MNATHAVRALVVLGAGEKRPGKKRVRAKLATAWAEWVAWFDVSACPPPRVTRPAQAYVKL